jgi:NAD+ synthase (glutamine-hydrolysing)
MHKAEERIDILRDRACRNSCYIAYCNMVGAQDELVFDGASLVLDPNGKVIAKAEQFREELLVVDISAESMHESSSVSGIEASAYLQSQQFSLETAELDTIFKGTKRKAVTSRIAKPLPEEEEVYRALVLGTRDFITKNGFKEVILGISGGIDSALTLAVAVEAIGKQNVHALFMPSRFTGDLSQRTAKRQCKLLGIDMEEVSIGPLHERYLELLKPRFGDTRIGLTEENIQARIRGNILMAYSNRFGYLVLNTSNKSEAAVGYTTLYGDMVGGFAVLEDIAKTLVYKICHYLNKTHKNEIIDNEIILREPTAELRANQKDSDSLPPYEILDEILRYHVELDMDDDEIVAKGFDKKVVAKVVRMVAAAEYKRRQSAPGIKITPRAFGKDRRWPITNKF